MTFRSHNYNEPWRHDETSGQVYADTIVRRHQTLDVFSSPEFRRHVETKDKRPSTTGSASLYRTALRSLLLNSGALDREVLREVPWQLAKRVWTQIAKCVLTYRERETYNISLWTTFLSAYPHDMPQRSFHGLLDSSSHSLSQCFPYLTSPAQIPSTPSLSTLNPPTSLLRPVFITSLTISTATVTREEVMTLAQLPNLIALDIGPTGFYAPSSPATDLVDDYVLRNWARRASSAGELSFPRLRLLLARNQHGISPEGLRWISALPTLMVFGVVEQPPSKKYGDFAKKYEWTNQLGLQRIERTWVDRFKTEKGIVYPGYTSLLGHAAKIAGALGAGNEFDADCLEMRCDEKTDEKLEGLGEPQIGLLNLAYTGESKWVSANDLTVFERSRLPAKIEPELPSATDLTRKTNGGRHVRTAKKAKLRNGKLCRLNAEGDLVEA